MDIDSNIDQVMADLTKLVEGFDFSKSVGDRSLGKKMAFKTAEMIQSRSIQFKKGTSVQWADNKEPYKTWKLKEYQATDVGVRTGQMLSQESLMGETEVTQDEVVMRYGTGQAPTRSATGAGFKADRDAATDKEKAKWFTEGRDNQPERPFYELDDDISAAVFEMVAEELEKHLGG